MQNAPINRPDSTSINLCQKPDKSKYKLLKLQMIWKFGKNTVKTAKYPVFWVNKNYISNVTNVGTWFECDGCGKTLNVNKLRMPCEPVRAVMWKSLRINAPIDFFAPLWYYICMKKSAGYPCLAGRRPICSLFWVVFDGVLPVSRCFATPWEGRCVRECPKPYKQIFYPSK